MKKGWPRTCWWWQKKRSECQVPARLTVDTAIMKKSEGPRTQKMPAPGRKLWLPSCSSRIMRTVPHICLTPSCPLSHSVLLTLREGGPNVLSSTLPKQNWGTQTYPVPHGHQEAKLVLCLRVRFIMYTLSIHWKSLGFSVVLKHGGTGLRGNSKCCSDMVKCWILTRARNQCQVR